MSATDEPTVAQTCFRKVRGLPRRETQKPPFGFAHAPEPVEGRTFKTRRRYVLTDHAIIPSQGEVLANDVPEHALPSDEAVDT